MSNQPQQPLTPEEEEHVNKLLRAVRGLSIIAGLAVALIIFRMISGPFHNPFGSEEAVIAEQPKETNDSDAIIEDGIDITTGLKATEGFELVRANCTGCHSAKLVTQNRATREGWEGIIRWMQETQKLWDLGKNEALILDYLAANYAPDMADDMKPSRRPPLHVEEWYEYSNQ